MKSYKELINQVKDLIRKNKTDKALELLNKEQLSTLDQQLILINSRYSKLKEEQTLGILDEDTAQRKLNKINVELLALADKIGKNQNPAAIENLQAQVESTIEETQTTPPPPKEIKKQPVQTSPPPKTSNEGKSKSKLLIGATVGILLVALIAYFGTQQSAKKTENNTQARIELAKKKRAAAVKDSLAQVELQNIAKTKKEAADRAKKIGIGKSFEGGTIYYIDETGQHGLIVAKVDQSTRPIKWFGETKGKAAAIDAGVYDGQKNTKLLVAKFKERNHPAQLCANYSFGNFDDWYLPSKSELNLLYEYNKTLPRAERMAPEYYWSSTEIANQDVYYLSFHNGNPYYWIKGNKAKVRAIRKF